MTLHSEAELTEPRDRQTGGQTDRDTAHIDNNSLHLMHSMQPKNVTSRTFAQTTHIELPSPKLSCGVGPSHVSLKAVNGFRINEGSNPSIRY